MMRIFRFEISKSKVCRVLIHILMFVIGATLLSLFSIFQKRLLGVSITPEMRGFIVPILFGGTSALTVSIILTQLRIANRKLRISQEYLQDFMDNASDLIQSVSPEGFILYTNQSWQETLGYSQAELTNTNIFDLIAEEDKHVCRLKMEEVLKGATVHTEVTLIAKDGKKVLLEGKINCRFENGKPISTRGIFRDITTKRDIEKAQRLAAKVFQRASDGIFVTDNRGFIITVNDAFTRISGYTLEDVTQTRPDEFFDREQTPNRVIERLHKVIAQGENWQGEIVAKRKTRESFPALLKIGTVQDNNGAVANFIGSINDITAQKQTEQRLQYLATHDALTNLPNRVLFVDKLQSAIWKAEQMQLQVGVLFLDLDGFKEINDEYGHILGDAYMKVVAKRIKYSIRTTDTAARLGGDEFAIILENIKGKKDAIYIADKILKNVSKTASVQKRRMKTTASIGISLYPDAETAESLLSSADQAMYIAKSDGKNRYHVHQLTPENKGA